MSSTIGLGVAVPKMLRRFLAPLAVYEFLLAMRVSLARNNTKTLLGEKSKTNTLNSHGIDVLNLAVRSHANFVEGVPFAVLLAAVAELNGANKKVLTWALALLAVGRVAHVEFGLLAENARGLGRVIGTLVTQSFIVGYGSYAAYLVKGYWGV